MTDLSIRAGASGDGNAAPGTTASGSGATRHTQSDGLTLHEAIRWLLDDFDLASCGEIVRDDAKADSTFDGLASEHPRVQKFHEVVETLRDAIR